MTLKCSSTSGSVSAAAAPARPTGPLEPDGTSAKAAVAASAVTPATANGRARRRLRRRGGSGPASRMRSSVAASPGVSSSGGRSSASNSVAFMRRSFAAAGREVRRATRVRRAARARAAGARGRVACAWRPALTPRTTAMSRGGSPSQTDSSISSRSPGLSRVSARSTATRSARRCAAAVTSGSSSRLTRERRSTSASARSALRRWLASSLAATFSSHGSACGGMSARPPPGDQERLGGEILDLARGRPRGEVAPDRRVVFAVQGPERVGVTVVHRWGGVRLPPIVTSGCHSELVGRRLDGHDQHDACSPDRDHRPPRGDGEADAARRSSARCRSRSA